MASKKISWKSLEHHGGAAIKVPEWVKYLVSGGDCRRYCSELESAFVYEGQSCTAAAPTIGLLLEQLPEAKKPEWVLRVIANIAGNDQLWAWLREPTAIVDDVAQILFEHRAELFAALKHESAAVRSAAAFALGAAPAALAPEATQQLNERLATDSSEHVLASSILALARLSPVEATQKATSFSTHESGLVRGAAIVARLRVDSQLQLQPLLPALADWLGGHTAPSTAPPEFWWWSRSPRFANMQGSFHARLQNAVVLVEMARLAGRVEAWTDAMLELPQHTGAGWAYRGATDFLAVANGFTNNAQHKVFKPSELSEGQQKLAQRLADSPLFATAGYGLPACGPVRRRWLGLEPPRLMETLMEFGRQREPLYWICSKRTYGDPPTPQVESLTGLDHWQFRVSTMTGEYNEDWYSSDANTVEASVNAAATDPAMKEVGPAVLNELAARIIECRRQHVTVQYTAESASLFVLPVLRAGVEWDPAWQPLIVVDGALAQLSHELLASIPAPAREAWLWANPQKLRVELTYVELLPSVRLVKRTLLKLAQFRREGVAIGDASLAVERKIHELGATLPHFAEALKEARVEGYEG